MLSFKNLNTKAYFLSNSESTKFSIRSEANRASCIVNYFTLWQPSYVRSLQCLCAIPRKHKKTTESNQLLSEGTFSVKQWCDAIPRFPRKSVTIKPRLLLIYWFSESLKHILFGHAADNYNDCIVMTLRERFWATKLLIYASNSNEGHSWIIHFWENF